VKNLKVKLVNFSVARGNSRGELNLHWDAIENTVSYMIEISMLNSAGNSKWQILDIISDSFYTVRNLKSNKSYTFRIASIDEKGRKRVSDGKTKTAP